MLFVMNQNIPVKPLFIGRFERFELYIQAKYLKLKKNKSYIMKSPYIGKTLFLQKNKYFASLFSLEKLKVSLKIN